MILIDFNLNIQAKLAAAGISDGASEETSEGEITSDNNKSQKSEAEDEKGRKNLESTFHIRSNTISQCLVKISSLI